MEALDDNSYLKKELSLIAARRSSRYTFLVNLRCFGAFIVGYLAAIWIFRNNPSLFWLAPMFYGWGAYRLQFVLHDCTHNSLFKSHRSNQKVGDFAGILVGVNFSRYRFTHIWHHRRNGQISDPQFLDYLGNHSVQGSQELSRKRFLWFIVSPLFGLRLFAYLKREVTMNSVEDRPAPQVSNDWYVKFAVAQLVILGGSVVLSGSILTPFLLLTGLCSVSLFLARLRAIAEHHQVMGNHPDYSRSHRFKLIDFVFLYDANFNYHLEHHLYPHAQSSNLRCISEFSVSKHLSVYPPESHSMFSTIFFNFKSLRW